MASANLDRAALIRKELEDADPDLLRDLLQEVVEALMSTEVDGLAGAAYGTGDPGPDQPAQRLPRPPLGHPRRDHRS